jgi:regulator of RNase E activity RraB
MKKCICAVCTDEGNRLGTGFFCNIPYKNQKLKVLITASSHIKNHLKRSKITIKLNDAIKEIKINDDRKIYLNENYNTAIIEINPSKDGINDFLELDEFFNERINERVYTIQLDREQNTCISFGTLIKIEENEIYHLCSTEKGSSGSPILNINTSKVIGIHLQSIKHENINMGTLLHHIIKDFNEDHNLVNLYNDKRFSNLKLISSGSYGDIYSAYSIKDKIEVCLKKINIEKMKLNYESNNLENYQKDLDNEINILDILSDNKNSINILGSYDNENEKIIVMEKCDQNLYEFIKKRGKALTVEEIKLKFEGINELFESIQRNYIIHRDLKLENFLIKYNKEKTDYVIKLGDYGIGKFKYKTNGIYSGLKGTIDTIAPEIILEKTKEYKSSVDIYV